MGQIQIVDEGGKVVESQPQEIKNPNTLVSPGSPELQIKAVASVLGIENASDITKNQDKLETLAEYAKLKSSDRSLEGIKWALRKLGERLNTPTAGEKWIDYMTRYAYLELESLKIKAEQKRFKK